MNKQRISTIDENYVLHLVDQTDTAGLTMI